MKFTIYDIKRLTEDTSPHFFTRKTMKFWGQTLKDFSVQKMDDGRYRISAPYRDVHGKFTNKYTERYFNPKTNELERE
jgi:hypothetical protein